MSYNKDTDYQSKIDEAVKSGDYKSAALYEKTRNEKIDGEKLNYQKTNNYSGWLDSTDYGTVIKNQMNAGASKKAVADTLKKRQQKAYGTVGLSQYTFDDIYDSAMKYLQKDKGFNFSKEAPVFRDNYSDDIRMLYDELLSREKFSYNPFSDELYSYYLNAYRREGDRAMEDVLGSLAANTGGVVNSYATLAASQAHDYYNQKAAEIIPRLYESAYQRYNDETKRLIDEILSVQDMSEAEYKRYSDMLEAYSDERSFEYNKYLDELDDNFRLSELGRDILNDDRAYYQLIDKNIADFQNEENRRLESAAERELEKELSENKLLFEREKYAKESAQKDAEARRKKAQDDIENAIKRWKTLGYLDEESAEILNLPAGTKIMGYK